MIILVAIAGCAQQPSLESLEDEALITGDWTKVEKRQKARSRTTALVGGACSDGLLLLCEENGNSKECACVPSYYGAGKVIGP